MSDYEVRGYRTRLYPAIEAVRFDGANVTEMERLLPDGAELERIPGHQYLLLKVLGRHVRLVEPGDWLKLLDGRVYVIPDGDFRADFDVDSSWLIADVHDGQ